jgi:hypothetical protein
MVLFTISNKCTNFTRYDKSSGICHKDFFLDFLMRVWITSSNDCHLLLEYDIHLDDSLIPDEQVR